MVRERTGLVLDPYFSGTKFARMLRDRSVAIDGDLALGTIDSWIIWKLTNGEMHVTDPTNASRTMLYNIVEHRWDDALCDALNVPIGALPEVRPSSGRFGLTSAAQESPTEFRSAELPVTNRRRCSGKPASTREWPRTPMAQAVLFFSTWEQSAHPSPTECSRRLRGTLARALRLTLLRGQFSSLVRQFSG